MIDAELTFDGDILKNTVLKKGNQERPLWSRMERLSPNEMLIWIDRFDSLCPIACEWALAQAIENSYDVKVPKRTQYVRTILNEINRLIWLTTYLGRILKTLGQKTLYQQIFVLREQVLTIQEELTGGRILPQAFAVGGCRRELPLGNIQKIRNFINGWADSWGIWLSLVFGDELLEARLRGLMIVDPNLVERLAWWGVIGKASGINYDSRRHRPHGAYPFLEMKLVERKEGDAKARFEVAIDEIKLSLNIIDQIVRDIPFEIEKRPEGNILKPGFYSGAAESAKGPVVSCIEVNEQNHISTVRLFSSGQRVWPIVDHLIHDIRGEDFELAFASLGVDSEDAEI